MIPSYDATIQKARRMREAHGTGTWIIESSVTCDDEEDMSWRPTGWRGVTLIVALEEMPRLRRENDEAGMFFRARDTETGDIIAADIL